MDIVSEIRRLAAESPDNKYLIVGPRCLYASGPCSNGSVGCIVGQALTAMGHNVSTLDLWSSVPTAYAAISQFITGYPDQKKSWALAVQCYQDRGKTWSAAVAEADAQYPQIKQEAVC